MKEKVEGTITIKSTTPEKEFMEILLNMTSTGYDVKLPFVLHAMANGWHIDKLIYYINLLEQNKPFTQHLNSLTSNKREDN